MCIAFFADSCSHLEIGWFDEACLLPLEADEKAESSMVGIGCSVETCRFPDLQNGNGAVFLTGEKSWQRLGISIFLLGFVGTCICCKVAKIQP